MRPLSPIINVDFSPNIKIFYAASNYDNFSFTVDIAGGIQYRFHKRVGIDTGLSFNTGMDYKKVKYSLVSGLECSREMYSVNLFAQFYFNLLVYFPLNIKLKDNYNLAFILKTGLKLDGWIMSYYFMTEKIGKDSQMYNGNFHDSVKDGPNINGLYYNYSKYINPINLGVHLGFAPKFYSNGMISIYPEIGYTFYVIPTFYGNRDKDKIGGYEYLLVRNNYDKNFTINDFKMAFDVGVSISFDFGTFEDNLSDIINKLKKEPKKEE